MEPAKSLDTLSRLFDTSILSLIVLNVVAVILESFSEISQSYQTVFQCFEIFSIIIFTIEYGLRVYTADCKYPVSNTRQAAWKYIKSPMAIIDLFAILPFYIPFFLPFDLRFMRILRLTRTLRILKLNRYSKSLQLLGKILSNKKADLLITLFVTFIMIIFASSAMYYLETDVQPEQFPNIIAAFWWAIATLTTVGYGDVYPVTILGKILSGIIALLGVGLVALPTGIVSSGFIEELEKTTSKSKPATVKSIRMRRNTLNRLRTKRRKPLNTH